MQQIRQYCTIFLTLALVAISMSAFAQKSGKTIFENRCTACHQVSNDDLVGPGLAHVNQRRNKEFLVKFIRNSQKVIKSGNEVAKKLFNEYNQTIMPANKDLSDKEIGNVLSYIKEQSQDVAEPVADQSTEDKEAEADKGPDYPKYSHLPKEQESDKGYAYQPNSFDFEAAFWMVVILVILAVISFTWMVIYFSR